MKTGYGKIVIMALVAVFVFTSLPGTASAVSTTTQGNVMVSWPKLKNLNNSLYGPELKGRYASSPGYPYKGKEAKANIIKSKKGKSYTFKTRYYLPVHAMPKGKEEEWSSVQSAMIVDNYLYTVIKDKRRKETYGRIIRYDMEKIDAMGAADNPNFLRDNWKYIGDTDAVYEPDDDKGEPNRETGEAFVRQLNDAIKIGPMFKMGHGQSLSYNWKTDEIWMWQDMSMKAAYYSNHPCVLQRIDPDALRADKYLKFKMRTGSGVVVASGHNLTFDTDGNFYFFAVTQTGAYPKGSAKLFKGRLRSGSKFSVKIHIVDQLINKGPGPVGQTIHYSKKDKKLYLGSDASFLSIPAGKIGKTGKGKIKKSELKATLLNTKRELESLTTDSNGKLYLFSNRGPELLMQQ
jgi:hypothetical protein